MRSRGSRAFTHTRKHIQTYICIMKVDGNRPLCASEWRPKATKVLQHVCSCSGYVHTNARSTHDVVRKCQLDVQFYAKNASRPAERRRIDSPWRPRRKRNRFAARAFGWHADSREIHQETVIFCLFHLLVSKKRPNEWRYTELFILWKRTIRRKILFPFSFLCEVKGQSEFIFLNTEVHWDFIICH